MAGTPFITKLEKFIIADRQVMSVILVNAVVLFICSFPEIRQQCWHPLFLIDDLCILYFLVEVLIKIKHRSWKTYWKSDWSKFDFIVVMISLPALLNPIIPLHHLEVLPLIRAGRLLRLLKLIRIIPDQAKLWQGIKRAMAASVGFVFTLCVYNLILAIGSTYLFGEIDPEHFGNPLISMYSIFKIITIEGWYEIPDTIAQKSTYLTGLLARVYFVFTVLTGGIIGLSLANAVFIDEMIIDNTNELENRVEQIKQELIKEIHAIKVEALLEKEDLHKKLDLLLEKYDK